MSGRHGGELAGFARHWADGSWAQVVDVKRLWGSDVRWRAWFHKTRSVWADRSQEFDSPEEAKRWAERAHARFVKDVRHARQVHRGILGRLF